MDIQKDLFGRIVSPGGSFYKSDRPYIVASISGGRSSGMMAYILENNPIYSDYEKVYVYMNTGRELPKTISFLKNIQDHIIKREIHIIEAKVYHGERKSSGYTVKTFDTISMNGEPFEEVIKKYGLPSVGFIHCTRELKINPIKEFIKEHLGLTRDSFRQAIGIRIDEARRINHDTLNFIYPLADLIITKKSVDLFWNSPEFKQYDLGSDSPDGFEEFEGNCDFCFKKSWNKLLLMHDKHPERLDWWKRMESKYGNNNEYPIFRDHKTTKDIENKVQHKNKNLDCLCGKSDELFF